MHTIIRSPLGDLVAPLAQLVEQLTLNQRVVGSNPSRRIGLQKALHLAGLFLRSGFSPSQARLVLCLPFLCL